MPSIQLASSFSRFVLQFQTERSVLDNRLDGQRIVLKLGLLVAEKLGHLAPEFLDLLRTAFTTSESWR